MSDDTKTKAQLSAELEAAKRKFLADGGKVDRERTQSTPNRRMAKSHWHNEIPEDVDAETEKRLEEAHRRIDSGRFDRGKR